MRGRTRLISENTCFQSNVNVGLMVLFKFVLYISHDSYIFFAWNCVDLPQFFVLNLPHFTLPQTNEFGNYSRLLLMRCVMWRDNGVWYCLFSINISWFGPILSFISPKFCGGLADTNPCRQTVGLIVAHIHQTRTVTHMARLSIDRAVGRKVFI